MTDFMFFILSKVFGADLKDTHDIPWSSQIIFFPILGFIISLTMLKFIGNIENNDDKYRR